MTESNESSVRVSTKTEHMVANHVIPVLDLMTGDRIQESSEYQELLSVLEYFVPEVLREIHPEWAYESLDAIFPLETNKIGTRTLSIFGHCLLISDQTMVPILVQIQVSPKGDKVDWFACNLGERGKSGLIRIPYQSSGANSFYGKSKKIDWTYMVAFGNRTD